MTRDQLDDLLNASAPAAHGLDDHDARAMISAAAAAAIVDAPLRHVPRPGRKRRAVMLSGALVLLFAGGAGVAAATSDWLWGDGLESPDRSYHYTSPTWGECEIRFSTITTRNPLDQAPVTRIVDEWFETTDVEAAAAPLVSKYLETLENPQAQDAAGDDDPRTPDLNAWTAHEQALSEALHNELAEHGYGPGTLDGAKSHSQVHCDGEDWGGEGGVE